MLFQTLKSVLRIGWRKPAFQAFQFCSYYRHSLVDDCLVPKFHHCKQPMNFGSRGSSELRVSPGHSSRIRHRNAFTQNHLRTLVLKFKRQLTWLSTRKGICPGIHKLEKTTFALKNNLKCAYKMPHGGGKTANGTFQDFWLISRNAWKVGSSNQFVIKQWSDLQILN